MDDELPHTTTSLMQERSNQRHPVKLPKKNLPPLRRPEYMGALNEPNDAESKKSAKKPASHRK